MIRLILLISFLSLYFSYCNGQGSQNIKQLDSLISFSSGDLNFTYIRKLLDRWPEEKNHNVIFFHIYNLKSSIDIIGKESFYDKSFLNFLTPILAKEKNGRRKILDASSVIITSHKVYEANLGEIYLYENQSVMKDELELINLCRKHKIDFVFYIYGTNALVLFGMSQTVFYVFEKKNESYDMYFLKEFIDCCWDDIYLKTTSY